MKFGRLIFPIPIFLSRSIPSTPFHFLPTTYVHDLHHRTFHASRTLLLATVDVEGIRIEIPEDKIDVKYSRSSGPGGQNVNKLSTKAEIRFHIPSADWIPREVKARFMAQQANKISKDGEIIITSQEQRTQARNRADCFDKLKVILEEACVEPKERNQYEGIGEIGKLRRRDEKRKRSEVKSMRRMSKSDYD